MPKILSSAIKWREHLPEHISGIVLCGMMNLKVVVMPFSLIAVSLINVFRPKTASIKLVELIYIIESRVS